MTDIQPAASSAQPKPFLSLDFVSRAALVFALLIVAGVALSFLLLALPSNDDFVRATQPLQLGFWNYFLKLYFKWQGRWVSFGLESAILPRGDMTSIYPLLIGAVGVIDLIGLHVVCRFLTRSASRGFSLACTAGLAAILWAQMPSLAQTVYWFVGGVENVMVLSLAGMLLVGIISIRPTIPWIMFAAGAAIIITGLHEAYGAMLCIALATGLVAAFWMRSENRFVWLVVLIAAVAGLGIVVAAPGNRVRMAKDVSHHVRHLSVVLKLAGGQLWNSGRVWLFNPKLLAASLFVAFSPRLEAARPVWPAAGRAPLRLLIPAAWVAMLCVGFFMPSWAFVDVMPPRTLSGNFIVFATGWLLIVFLWTRKLDTRTPVQSPAGNLTRSRITSFAMLVLAVSLVLEGNTREALHDLITGKVFRWRTSVESRYANLRNHPGEDLLLTRLAPSSRLLYSSEIWIDPANWTNFSLADYFHVKSVRVLPIAGKDPTTAPAAETAKPAQNM